MNKLITYILADDDPLYRELTIQQLAIIPGLQCLAVCDDAISTREKIAVQQPDLLILDIEMPGLTGIQLAKSLTNVPLVIFISSHAHYAADAFEVDAVDYLVKPVPQERLFRAVDKVKNLLQIKAQTPADEAFSIQKDDSFFIKDKNSFVRVAYADVLYIESLGDFINIYLKDGSRKIALVSLKNAEQQLPSTIFVRISRTHMVNRHNITALDNTTAVLNKIKLPMGKSYAEKALQAILGDNAIKRFL
ncbi:MAG: hypothetical protein JWQ27_1561 [Ferruginibacter sp.]|nr:hypothetical protein [Ferruginibacter sp.]